MHDDNFQESHFTISSEKKPRATGTLDGVPVDVRVFVSTAENVVNSNDTQYLGSATIIIAEAVKIQFLRIIRAAEKILIFFPEETKKEVHRSCGFRVPLGYRYCPECGEKLRDFRLRPSHYRGLSNAFPVNSRSRGVIEAAILTELKYLCDKHGVNPWEQSTKVRPTDAETAWRMNLDRARQAAVRPIEAISDLEKEDPSREEKQSTD